MDFFSQKHMLLFSHSVVSDSLQPHGLQHIRLPVLYYLLEFAQTHVHWVGDAIQTSHSLWSHSPFALNLSQHQNLPKSQLFAWGGQRAKTSALASVLPVNIQGWFPLGLTGLIPLLSKGLSRVFSSTTVQKHQFFGTQPSLWSNSYIHTWLPEIPWLSLSRPLSTERCLCFLICSLGLS